MDIKNMPVEEIEAFLKDADADVIENKIEELVDIFLSDTRPNDRNKIALILSDYGGNTAVDPIIEMLKRPATKGYRGTLLYALNDLDCMKHIDFLFELLVEGDFEVSREAFIIIDRSLNQGYSNLALIKKQIPLLINKIRELQDEADFYLSAIRLLSK